MTRLFYILLAISYSCLTVQANLEEVKQNLLNKEYTKAYKAIALELSKENASLELLELGSKAAWGAGQTITAQKAITAFLRQQKEAPASAYYLGAQIAESLGQKNVAAARYQRYIQKTTVASPQLKAVLATVLQKNPRSADFTLWVKHYLKDPSTFYLGMGIIDTLIKDNRVNEALQVTVLLLQNFRTLAQTSLLNSKISSFVDKGDIDNDADRHMMIEAMASNPLILSMNSPRKILDSFGPKEHLAKLKGLMALHKNGHIVNNSFNDWSTLSSMKSLDQIKDVELQKSYITQYLALGERYRKSNKPKDLLGYLYNIIQKYPEFKKSGLYKNGDTDMALLAEAYKGTSDINVRRTFNYYSDRFLNNEQRKLFLEKYISFIDCNHLTILANLHKNTNSEKLLATWKSFRDPSEIYRELGAIFNLYRSAKLWDKALATIDLAHRAKGYINIKSLLQTNEFNKDKVSAMLLKWIEEGGESRAIKEQLKLLNNWGEGKGSKIIAAHKASSGKTGKDPILSALMMRYRITGNTGNSEFDKAIERASDMIGSALSMRYEDATSLKIQQIQTLCIGHNLLSYRGIPAMKRVGDFWLPRIAIPGEASVSLIYEYFNRGHTHPDAVKIYQSWLATGKVSDTTIEAMMSSVRVPKDTNYDPMEPLIKSHPKNYLIYYYQNYRLITPEAIAENAMKALSEHLRNSDYYFYADRIPGNITSRMPKKGVPAAAILELAKASFEYKTKAGIRRNDDPRPFLNMTLYAKAPELFSQLYSFYQSLSLPKKEMLHYQEHFSSYAAYYEKTAFLTTFSDSWAASIKAASPDDLKGRNINNEWARRIKRKTPNFDLYSLFEKGLGGSGHNVMEYYIYREFQKRIAARTYKPHELRPLLENFGQAYSRYGHIWNMHMPEIVTQLEKIEQYELAYSLVDKLSENHLHKDQISSTVNVLKGRLSRNVSGLIPVKKGHPQYNIYLAQQALGQGLTGRAWELLYPSLVTYLKEWETFGLDVGLFVADRLRNAKRFEACKTFCQTILLKELSFDAKSMAKVNLIKADIFRDTQNFQAARVSYNELVNNQRFRGTQPAKEAKLRLIDLLLLTKDLTAAEMEAQRLIDANDIMDQAEGYYYLSKVAFLGEDYELANDQLKDVFKRNVHHNQAKLLKGKLRLFIRAGLSSTQVDIGTSQRQEIAVPGKQLTLKLQDANLAIARGGKAIPVVVTTSKGNDREKVQLMVDQDDSTLFKGVINTALGMVKKGNLQLELRGDDIISYLIDPEFQKANNLDYDPKLLVVKSTGRLVASSGEILSAKEQEAKELAKKLGELSGDLSAKDKGRSSKTIRPGNPVHVQVTDMDQDLSDQPDSVEVTLLTDAGDLLKNWKLEETGAHTGIFRGAVPTSSPAPMAKASDIKEGTDAYGPINSNRSEPWESLADGKAPKWYDIDTMNSHALKSAGITMPKVDSITAVKLIGYLGETEFNLGQWPTSKNSARGGINISMRYNHRGVSIRETSNYIKQKVDLQASVPTPDYSGKREFKFKGNGWRTVSMEGVFWLETTQMMNFKLMHEPSPHNWQVAHFFIDGKQILSGPITQKVIDRVMPAFLSAGPHTIKVLIRDHAHASAFKIGYKNPEGEFVSLPEEWFSPEKNPKLATYLKPLGKVSKTKDGFTAQIQTEQRLRSLRWIFEEFSGSSVSVSTAHLTSKEGATIIPVKEDFTTGLSNKILEVGPGDQIEVTYEDVKRFEDDPSTLSKQLDASYYNGKIGLTYEKIYQDRKGDTRSLLFDAKRIGANDQLLIRAEEWDEDNSDERDTLEALVETSSGESLKLSLIETGLNEEQSKHSGVFTQILTFGTETKGTTIKTLPGDVITISYLDKENTIPGVPVLRKYKVASLQTSPASLKMFLSSTVKIEDRSLKAKATIKKLRQRGDTRKDISIYKSIVTAEPVAKLPTANLQAPLLFYLNYPAGARHSGSVVSIEVLTTSEEEAARTEERDPVPILMTLRLEDLSQLARQKGYDIKVNTSTIDSENALELGQFSGLLRFQLGSLGDEPNTSIDTDSSSTTDSESRASLEKVLPGEEDRFMVPTIVVKGSDKVTLRFRNKAKEVLAESSFELASDATIGLYDPQLVSERPDIHLGQSFQVQLKDADKDISDELDEVVIDIETKKGTKKSWNLKETLPHSGVFTSKITPEFKKPVVGTEVPATTDSEDSRTSIPVSFGDSLTFSYTDKRTVKGEELVAEAVGSIHKGSDGEIQGFTKKYKNPEIAVRTQFLIAEAMFEMAKDHRKLKKTELAAEEIAEGKRVLEEALRDYPETNLKAQGEYLLANLAEELKKHEEAIGRYSAVISGFPKSEFASKSQFKKALNLEKLKQDDRAMEEYVRLTYLYPTDELVADATVRLGNFYYKSKQYKTAGRIFEQFHAAHSEHKLGIKALFLAGQSYIKMESYEDSVRVLSNLIESYPDDTKVRPEAMYWLADSNFQAGDHIAAYRGFKKLTWDYPSHKYAKIARGRLTEDSFARIAEGE